MSQTLTSKEKFKRQRITESLEKNSLKFSCDKYSFVIRKGVFLNEPYVTKILLERNLGLS